MLRFSTSLLVCWYVFLTTANTSDDYIYRLDDPSIQGTQILYLNNNPQYHVAPKREYNWTLKIIQNQTVLSSIPARIPGDIISDLVRAKITPEPYFENNFQQNFFCQPQTILEYQTYFDSSEILSKPSNIKSKEDVVLVFDGIKMGANIYINNDWLGQTTDQFLRYSFPLDAQNLKRKQNSLRVRFDSSILTQGRFMACSGGWDWAPFSTCPKTSDTESMVFTSGIVKSVYLVTLAPSAAAITAVVPQTFYLGDYPTKALEEYNHAGFKVVVRVHLWSSKAVSGKLRVQGSWGGKPSNTTKTVQWEGGETNITLTIQANAKDIKLWWPTGTEPNIMPELSKRNMYKVLVTFIENSNPYPTKIQDSRRVGFRHFALVTGNDTDPLYVKDSVDKEGTSFHGMYFRVNGLPIYSRGANMVPMDELEGRFHAGAHVQLVKSAVLANMNTLRVWGGGLFLPSSWYDACDDYGILVVQDQMYAQNGHDPQRSDIEEREIRHNIRILSSHPSIVIWTGCNECTVNMKDSSSIYATFVMTVVAQEDGSRAVWPSCPASGWKSGVERLTALPVPESALITPDPQHIKRTIEIHGEYIHGGGFPAVNGNDDLEPLVDPKIPVKIDEIRPETTGITFPSLFASEFGCGGVMSSFESMSVTLKQNHWNLHGNTSPDTCTKGFNKECKGGNVMAQRNYPCDNIIMAYFSTEPGYFEMVGRKFFQRQLFHCMLGQALQMKSTIEERRAKNELGHLVWQLNEIWPTGGWGSLEYGNPNMRGQVMGGRWKPLHYFFRSSTFHDILVTCNEAGLGYIRNDAARRNFIGSIVIDVVSIETGVVNERRTVHRDIHLLPGPASVQTFKCPIVDGRTHFLSIDVLRRDQSLVIHNSVLLKPPKDLMANIPCNSGLEVSILEDSLGETNVDHVLIQVTSKVPVALFVLITTKAHGRFSDNAFTMIGGSQLIRFYSFGTLDLELLRTSLRVEDMAMYHNVSGCKDSISAE